MLTVLLFFKYIITMFLFDEPSVNTQAKDIWTHTEGLTARWVKVIKPN